MNTFAELDLIDPLCRALKSEGYSNPTPIQGQSIPHLLSGGDLLGSAQTGTGKTASFALPVLQHIASIGKRTRRHEVRSLILTPTRELAIQVADSVRKYGKFTKATCTTVYGGVGYGPQIKALRGGVDVLVATPGRLLDLFYEGHLKLDYVKLLVLDEADRMLDMGFKKDLEKIISETAKDRQTILFSATMPPEIAKFANKYLSEPKRVDISPKNITANNINDQVIFLKSDKKNEVLFELLRDEDIDRAIVFTRTKYIAERLSKKLNAQEIRSEAIHGNKSQGQRQKSLGRFRNGKARVLVATDVAARGIDVDGITHVFNYQLSNEPESYVHRIGRTARAGRSGRAVTLCDHEELAFLKSVEKLLKRKIDVNEESEHFDSELAEKFLTSARSSSGRPGRSRGGRGSAGRRRNDRRRSDSRKTDGRRPDRKRSDSKRPKTSSSETKRANNRSAEGRKTDSPRSEKRKPVRKKSNKGLNHRGRRAQKRPAGGQRKVRAKKAA